MAEISYYKNVWVPAHINAQTGQADQTVYTFQTLDLKVSAIEKVEIRNWSGSLDITAAAPSAPDLIATSDSGASSTDNKTNDDTPTVTGNGAEAGATVTLYDTNGTTVLGSTVADSSGNWTITSIHLADGDHTLAVKQTDLAGNTSAASPSLTVTIDTVAAAPSAPDLIATSDSGASSTDNKTNDDTPTVTGNGAEAGATVTLYDTNGTTVLGSTVADSSGNWTITSIHLADGDHTLAVKQTDLAGNTSAASPSLTVTIDTTIATLNAPDLATSSDSAGPGGTTSDDLTNDATPSFTIDVSTATAGDTIELLDGGSSFATPITHTLTAGEIAAGSYTLTAATLGTGAHDIAVKLSDAAGNSSTSAALTVTIDTTIATLNAPDLATSSDSAGPGGTTSDDLTNDATPSFTIDVSTATAGDTIELLDGGSSFATPITHTLTAGEIAAGSYTLTAATLGTGAHDIAVKLSDAAGNSSTSAALTVTIDTTIATLNAPDLATSSDSAGPGGTTSDDLTNDATPSFTIDVSTATAGDTIELLDGGSSFATPITHTLTAGEIAAGSYTLTAATLGTGAHDIAVKLSDAAGNSSTSAALTVTIDTTIATLNAPDLATSSDSAGPGGTTSDDLTNDATPSFTIDVSTATAGDTIELLDGGSSFATPITHTLTAGEIAAGSYTLTAATLGTGAHDIAVKLSDAAGNSSTSAALTVTIDTTIATLNAPDLATSSDSAGPGGTTSDDLTNDATPSFTIDVSTATAGDTIELLDGGSSFATPITHTLTAGEIAAGSYTLTAATLGTGAHDIAVKLSDAAGNSSTSAALTVTIDTTIATLNAPDLATSSDSAGPGGTTSDDLTNDATPSFTIDVSTATAGDTIELLDGGSSFATPITHTLTAGEIAAGSYTLTAATLGTGAHDIAVKLSDAAGNSSTSAALTVTIDTTIATLNAPDLATSSDSAGPGGTTSDDLTNDATPSFTIDVSTATAGDTIELLDGGSSFATPITHTLTAGEIAAGSYTLTAATLGTGAHDIAVKLSDAAGNSSTSAALTVTIDTTIATLNAPDLATSSDSAGPGGTTSDDLTNDATPSFTIDVSTATAGDTIELLDGGSSFATPITHTLTAGEIAAGSYTLTAATLGTGAHDIAVKLSDAAGNSSTSAALTVTIDTTIATLNAPDLATSSDSAGPGGTTSDDLTNDATPSFTIDVSTATAGDTIELLDGGSSFATPITHTLTAGEIAAGSYTLTAATLGTGAHDIAVKLSDAAGNSSTSAALTVTIDTTIATLNAPDLATSSDSAGPGGTTSDDLTNDATPSFTIDVSTATAGDTIELLDGGSSFATPITHTLTAGEIAAGSYTLTAATLGTGAHDIAVKLSDAAGNSSTSAALTVTIDTTIATLNAPDLATSSDSAGPGGTTSDDLTNDATPSFTIDVSTATAGDTIELLDGGSSFATPITHTLTAGEIAAGSYTLTAATLGTGAHDIAVKLSDAAGNSSTSAALTVTIDTTIATLNAPDLATSSDSAGPGGTTSDDLTNDATPSFTIDVSTATAGDTIELLDGGSSFATPITHTLTAGEIAAGSYTLTAATLGTGAHDIAVKLSDAAGNSSTSAALTVTIDTTIATLNAPDLATSSDSAGPGGTTSDDLTNDATPSFTIDVSTATAGDTIELLDGGSSFATPITHTLTAGEIAAGSYTLTAATLGTGAHDIAVKLSDAAGNSSTSAALTVTIDTTIATLNAPDLATSSDSAGPGGTTSDDLTNDATPSFTIDVSTATAGDTIELLDGGSSFATPITHTLTAGEIAAGSYTLTAATLGTGAHDIAVKLSDAAGNSSTSAALTVTIDTTIATLNAPDLATSSDSAGPGGTTSDDLTNDATPSFTIDVSTATAGDTIELLDGGSSFATPITHTLTAGEIAAGSYTLTAATLGTGAHDIAVKLSDAAGNSSTSAALTVTIDTTIATLNAPDLATSSDSAGPGGTTSDDLTNDATPSFTIDVSTATAGDTIELLDGGSSFATPITHTLTAGEIAAGSYTLTAATLGTGAHDIAVKLSDAAGNSSTSAALTVTIDTTAPTATVDLTAIATDSGTSPTDFITNDTTLTASGTNSALGSGEKIQISSDGGANWADVVQNTGTTWSYVDPTTHSTSFTYQVRVVDTAGNVGNTDTQAVTIDTTAPTATVDLTAIATDSGTSPTDFITNDTTLTASGTNSALGSGEKIQISGDGGANWADVTQNTGTTWSYVDPTTHSTSFTYQVRVVDTAGNVGNTDTQAVTIDTTAPTATVDLTAIATDSGTSPTDFITNDTTLTASGTNSALGSGEKIQISGDGGANWADVTQNTGTTWSYVDPTTHSTSFTYQVRVVDTAGNVGNTDTQAVTIDTAAAPLLSLASAPIVERLATISPMTLR
ncbi:Ig-like domain-containing protein [Bradyrhizobium elkanii]|uniref:Ig-like domain-containing protein n=1 Tax=Bradyrhizobium elkanii TaxID=29448 RepID=UPI0027148B52|nr:Ig-like domain-containing protein [Bradyrhizobium elkanii]WLA94664.1 Ig-like domain-containing protein [Bradyrhizobium elkanii]